MSSRERRNAIGREGEVQGSIPAGDIGADRGRRGVGAASPADGEGRARGGKRERPVEEAAVSRLSGAAVVGAGEADEGGTGSARPTASDFAFPTGVHAREDAREKRREERREEVGENAYWYSYAMIHTFSHADGGREDWRRVTSSPRSCSR